MWGRVVNLRRVANPPSEGPANALGRRLTTGAQDFILDGIPPHMALAVTLYFANINNSLQAVTVRALALEVD